MNILLFGKNGQVGFELQRSLAPLATVVAVGSADVDLTNVAAIRRVVQDAKPTFIVNAAAYTAVDKAESEPELARAVNAIAPTVIGEEAARLRAIVVHFSTDYVFDGAGTVPYTEEDVTHPLSVYGMTKLEGEQALASVVHRHLILRTSWVAGAHGGNFAKTILQLAGERETLRVVADQHGAPTPAALLADATAHVLQWAGRADPDDFPFGLYHVTAGGEATWYEYAQFVIAAAMRAGGPVLATPDKVMPISTADFPTPARRPANSRLNTTHFQKTFGLRLPPWREGIDHMLQQIL